MAKNSHKLRQITPSNTLTSSRVGGKNRHATVKQWLVDLIGLQTPGSRLTVILGISASLYSISYSTLLSIPTISIFARLHVPSPSIGLTRAYWYLIHGQFGNAWHMNKLIFIVFGVIVGLVVIDSVTIARNLLKAKEYTS